MKTILPAQTEKILRDLYKSHIGDLATIDELIYMLNYSDDNMVFPYTTPIFVEGDRVDVEFRSGHKFKAIYESLSEYGHMTPEVELELVHLI